VTGRQAVSLGLVDRIGTQADAIAELKTESGITGRARLVEGPVEERTFVQELMGSLKIDLSSSLPQGWSFFYK
jgi:protease-4